MKEEYKSICDKCYRKTWYETEQQCHCEYPKTKTCKTCNHTETIEPMKMERCKGILRLISNENLNPLLHSFYSTGERVEVKTKYNTIERFYVGKSMGWKPCYLKILKSNSQGGEAIGKEEILTVRGLNIYK